MIFRFSVLRIIKIILAVFCSTLLVCCTLRSTGLVGNSVHVNGPGINGGGDSRTKGDNTRSCVMNWDGSCPCTDDLLHCHVLGKEADALEKDSVYRDRLRKAQNICFKRSQGHAQRIIVNRDKTASMCVVPKAGCTFWINIFRFINNETEGVNYSRADDIPRWVTHYGHKQTADYALNGNGNPNKNQTYVNVTSFLGASFRFMFVRDPFRRLWSAWVDKFFLPDFWFTEGISVAKLLHFGSQNVTGAASCPINITFHQFLLYITDGYFTKYPHLINAHWAPYHFLCDPCVFRPHLIGKMETFERDTHAVLSVLNLTDLEPKYFLRPTQVLTVVSVGLDNNRTNNISSSSNKNNNNNNQQQHGSPQYKRKHNHLFDSRAMREMKMLTDYTFDGLWKAEQLPILFRGCDVTELLTARRLWRAFQINGYLPKHQPLRMTQWSRKRWVSALQQAYSTWNPDLAVRGKEQRKQRDEAMVEGYREIPLGLLRKVQRMYRADADQFEYEIEPDQLFGRRSTLIDGDRSK